MHFPDLQPGQAAAGVALVRDDSEISRDCVGEGLGDIQRLINPGNPLVVAAKALSPGNQSPHQFRVAAGVRIKRGDLLLNQPSCKACWSLPFEVPWLRTKMEVVE